MVHFLVRLFDIRGLYLLWRPFGYWKIGISFDPRRRHQVIKRSVRGKVFKIIAPPIIFASGVERFLLLLTMFLEKAPPVVKGMESYAGLNEWRWCPFLGWIIAPLIYGVFAIQVLSFLMMIFWASGFLSPDDFFTSLPPALAEGKRMLLQALESLPQ